MRLMSKNLTVVLYAALLAAPVFAIGCAAHERVYDPYYHDYHGRNGEAVYYNQWEHDTHRDHVDFNKRSANDQKEYWNWRHSQH